MAAELLHRLQAPDERAVETDRRARTCQEEEEAECEEEDLVWRRSDGECNNLERRSLGSSQSAYKRLLPPAYSDSQLNFRLSVSGSALPSARAVPAR